MTKRIDTYDIMKFVGIVLVIIGHMTDVGRNVIFSFHMPLFFILAGYFYHERCLDESVRKDVKHLVYPYWLTSVFIIVTYIIASLFKEDINLQRWFIAMLYGSGSAHSSMYFGNIPSIGAIWFLLALFWCKNVFNVIKRFCKHWLIASFIVSGSAIILDNYVINLPFALLPGLGAVMFYAIGYLIKQKGGFKNFNPYVGAICILLWFVSFLSPGLLCMVKCYYPNIVVNVLGAIGGTYALFLVCNSIPSCNYPLYKIVIWGGQNSLTFLCIHLYDLDVPIRGFLHIPNVVGIPLIIVVCFIGTFILSKIPFTRKVYNIKPYNFSKND